MIRLTKILTESLDIEESSDASEKAKQMGLDYMSFGRWGKDGKVTHKTQDGKLIPISDKQKSSTVKPTSKKAVVAKRKVAPEKPVNPASTTTMTKQPNEFFTFTDTLTDELLSVIDKQDVQSIVNVTSKFLGRDTPVKVKKPGFFAKIGAIISRSKGQELLGTYNAKTDFITFYSDVNQIISKSPLQWSSDDSEYFNTVIHESIHSASPRLKNGAYKKMNSVHMSLEEGITQFISETVTKKIQVRSQKQAGVNRGIVMLDTPYDKFVKLFKFLDYGGVDVHKLFMNAKTADQLAEITDIEGQKIINAALSKQFSETERSRIMENATSTTSRVEGLKPGHILISKQVASVMARLLTKNVSNDTKSKKITLRDLGMEPHEIENILDKETSV